MNIFVKEYTKEGDLNDAMLTVCYLTCANFPVTPFKTVNIHGYTGVRGLEDRGM